jgi:hypothetical protein
MQIQNTQVIEELTYRKNELEAALPYLSGAEGDLTYKLKIEVVEAIYDKSRRTFIRCIVPIREKSPEGFGLSRAHLSGLRHFTRRLQEIKLFDRNSWFLTHASVEKDVKRCLSNAQEDIEGLSNGYDLLLNPMSID